MQVLIGAALLGIAVIAFVILTAPRAPAPGSPAMTTAQPPWPAQAANLRARPDAIDLPALSVEGPRLHNHQHLDL